MKKVIIAATCLFTPLVLSSCGHGNSAENIPANDARPKPEPLSDTQKKMVLDTSKLVLGKFFAHAAVNTNGLPLNDVDVFSKNPESINSVDASQGTSDFLFSMEKAFDAQHDLHTRFVYPKPLQCYAAGIYPKFLGLKIAYDDANKPYVAVSHVESDRILSRYFKEETISSLEKLSNSVISAIDDVPVFDILNSTGNSSKLSDFNRVAGIADGANRDAQLSRGLESLFYRSGLYTSLPEGSNEDPSLAKTFTVTYEKFKGDQVEAVPQKVTLPWQIFHTVNCSENEGKSQALNGESFSHLKSDFFYGRDNFQNMRPSDKLNLSFFKVESKLSNLTSSINTNVDNPPSFDVIKSSPQGKEGQNYIYINVPSFMPTVNGRDSYNQVDDLLN